MRELVRDPFYGFIGKYDRCVVEYCLIADDTPYRGMSSHKAAVQFAMRRVIGRETENLPISGPADADVAGNEPVSAEWNIEKAKARPVDPASLLFVPDIAGKDFNGNVIYNCDRSFEGKGGEIPYWYAFIVTPHVSGYGPADFRRINEALFPKGADELEVFAWSTDWSDFFDDGHEWWGAACWSVFDRRMNRFVVLMASTTD